jgi:hypothetical protein
MRRYHGTRAAAAILAGGFKDRRVDEAVQLLKGRQPPPFATIAALAAMGDDDQLDVYVRRGLESGLTRSQITEALTHLGFYAGWPKATRAMSAVTRSFGK